MFAGWSIKNRVWLKKNSDVERVPCPKRARTLLSEMVKQRHLKGLLYQDGSLWVVMAGRHLFVLVDKGQSMSRVVYYLQQGAPATLDSAANTPAQLKDMLAFTNSAVNPSAVVSGGVARFNTLQTALDSWKDATPEELVLLLVNGPTDPAYYLVRTAKSVSNPIVTSPGFTGTVYQKP